MSQQGLHDALKAANATSKRPLGQSSVDLSFLAQCETNILLKRLLASQGVDSEVTPEQLGLELTELQKSSST